ncbi:uncharacterized protein LY89DRAFT_675890 [Mollisia scopiformis]|uniref:Uncharacterized protein n=1 Tax=Mollisia scopiformis TaxID=149040 RepID=A0A132BBG7_MOLSC|nr:uncharacterized protein LY89DRAFT_675890 [Mollisia scopiformis]KUJ09731.1 hypothetical protein LY89DRAFT_675890 [Mollisia scopiformis]
MNNKELQNNRRQKEEKQNKPKSARKDTARKDHNNRKHVWERPETNVKLQNQTQNHKGQRRAQWKAHVDRLATKRSKHPEQGTAPNQGTTRITNHQDYQSLTGTENRKQNHQTRHQNGTKAKQQKPAKNKKTTPDRSPKLQTLATENQDIQYSREDNPKKPADDAKKSTHPKQEDRVKHTTQQQQRQKEDAKPKDNIVHHKGRQKPAGVPYSKQTDTKNHKQG